MNPHSNFPEGGGEDTVRTAQRTSSLQYESPILSILAGVSLVHLQNEEDSDEFVIDIGDDDDDDDDNACPVDDLDELNAWLYECGGTPLEHPWS